MIDADTGSNLIKAHRLLLSSKSKVFDATLSGAFVEANEKTIKVHREYKIFYEFIKSFYTGTINCNINNLSDYLELYRYYQIDINKILNKNDINVGDYNIIKLIYISVTYNIEDLLESCIAYICRFSDHLLTNAEFVNDLKKYPDVFMLIALKKCGIAAVSEMKYSAVV